MTDRRYTKSFLGIEGYADDCPFWWGLCDAALNWLWRYPRSRFQGWLIERSLRRHD